MATKLAGGSTKNGRDSNPKYLGVKLFGGQVVKKGNIVIRQRGTPFHAGKNMKRTADDTLIAMSDGVIHFSKRKVRGFTGNLVNRKFVSVIEE
jgi:large subunit ribosomal protein L27